VLSDALDEHDGDEPDEDGGGGLVSRDDHGDDTGRGRSRFVVMVSPE